jgi:hypothetical protein
MATQTKAANNSVDTAVERAQELNDRVIDATRKASNLYLDTTEKTVNGLADLEVKLADATQVEWISAVASAQADLARDVTKVYVSSARDLLAK